jgi:carboxylesterase
MLGRGEAEFTARGRSPCIVAFHGFAGTTSEIRPVLEALAEAGHAVDGALLRGHGTRVEELQACTFDDWVESARARVRTAVEAHDRVVLVGFSLGSLVAMQIASERPAGLAGLVVLGNALTLAASMSVPMQLWELLRRPVPDLYLVKPWPGDLVDKTHMDDVLTYDRHPLRAAMEVYQAGPRVAQGVGRIACATLAVHGRRDIVCPWRNATWLAAHVGTRNVGVALYESSAHLVAWDTDRQAVAREIVNFVRSCA